MGGEVLVSGRLVYYGVGPSPFMLEVRNPTAWAPEQTCDVNACKTLWIEEIEAELGSVCLAWWHQILFSNISGYPQNISWLSWPSGHQFGNCTWNVNEVQCHYPIPLTLKRWERNRETRSRAWKRCWSLKPQKQEVTLTEPERAVY